MVERSAASTPVAVQNNLMTRGLLLVHFTMGRLKLRKSGDLHKVTGSQGQSWGLQGGPLSPSREPLCREVAQRVPLPAQFFFSHLVPSREQVAAPRKGKRAGGENPIVLGLARPLGGQD